jgi:hypothetical protein
VDATLFLNYYIIILDIKISLQLAMLDLMFYIQKMRFFYYLLLSFFGNSFLLEYEMANREILFVY